jgi:hypothetical protein
MLDVPVAEVVLQSPRVMAIVGELEPTGMAHACSSLAFACSWLRTVE